MVNKKVYCSICERYVRPKRKNIPHKYHELWFFLIILTFGVGLIVYLIMKLNQKKNRCPYCERTFQDLTHPPEGPIG